MTLPSGVVTIRTASSEADHLVIGRDEQHLGRVVVLGKADLIQHRRLVAELSAGKQLDFTKVVLRNGSWISGSCIWCPFLTVVGLPRIESVTRMWSGIWRASGLRTAIRPNHSLPSYLYWKIFGQGLIGIPCATALDTCSLQMIRTIAVRYHHLIAMFGLGLSLKSKHR